MNQNNNDNKWKFLVIADETPEFKKVLRLASLRARKVGGTLVMLRIIEDAEFQHWVSVQELMKEEARLEAQEMLDQFADEMYHISGMTPETVIRFGNASDVITNYIHEDQDIHLLVLGASPDGDPGPIVRTFREKLLNVLHMPVMVVPGNMTDDEIDKFV